MTALKHTLAKLDEKKHPQLATTSHTSRRIPSLEGSRLKVRAEEVQPVPDGWMELGAVVSDVDPARCGALNGMRAGGTSACAFYLILVCGRQRRRTEGLAW